MKSMTGFGRASSSENGRDVTVEIKSVNSRFLDLSFRLPRTFQAMELKIRQIVKGSISRGKVEVFLSVEDRAERDKKLLVNKVLAERYKTEITELSKSLGLPCSLNAERIFFYPEVFRLAEEEMEEDEEALIAVVKKAVEEFVYSRSEEGKKLRADLEEKLSEMQGYIAFFKEREPEIRLQYEKRLRRKIEDCLEGRNIDEGRI